MKSDLDEILTGRIEVIVRSFLSTSDAVIHLRKLPKNKLWYLRNVQTMKKIVTAIEF